MVGRNNTNNRAAGGCAGTVTKETKECACISVAAIILASAVIGFFVFLMVYYPQPTSHFADAENDSSSMGQPCCLMGNQTTPIPYSAGAVDLDQLIPGQIRTRNGSMSADLTVEMPFDVTMAADEAEGLNQQANEGASSMKTSADHEITKGISSSQAAGQSQLQILPPSADAAENRKSTVDILYEGRKSDQEFCLANCQHEQALVISQVLDITAGVLMKDVSKLTNEDKTFLQTHAEEIKLHQACVKAGCYDGEAIDDEWIDFLFPVADGQHAGVTCGQ